MFQFPAFASYTLCIQGKIPYDNAWKPFWFLTHACPALRAALRGRAGRPATRSALAVQAPKQSLANPCKEHPRSFSFARPEAVAAYAARRPQRSDPQGSRQREDKGITRALATGGPAAQVSKH